MSTLSCTNVAPVSQVRVCNFITFRKVSNGIYDARVVFKGVCVHCRENCITVSEVETDGRTHTHGALSVFLLGKESRIVMIRVHGFNVHTADSWYATFEGWTSRKSQFEFRQSRAVSFLQSVHTGSGVHPASYSMGTRRRVPPPSPEVKRLGPEASHSLPAGVEIKNVQVMPPRSHMPVRFTREEGFPSTHWLEDRVYPRAGPGRFGGGSYPCQESNHVSWVVQSAA
jgi:hypothetical protein